MLKINTVSIIFLICMCGKYVRLYDKYSFFLLISGSTTDETPRTVQKSGNYVKKSSK